MRNLLFLILFICSTWNILSGQQRVAPFSLGGKYIHKLDSCFTLTDSINFEVENVEHNQSQQIQAYQIKDYCNTGLAKNNRFYYVIGIQDSTYIGLLDSLPLVDANGDTCKLVFIQYERNGGGCQYEFYLKLLDDNDPVFNIPEFNAITTYLNPDTWDSKNTSAIINYQTGGQAILIVREYNTQNEIPSSGDITLSSILLSKD